MKKIKQKNNFIKFSIAILISFCVPNFSVAQNYIDVGKIGRDAISRNSGRLEFAFADDGVKFGAPIFMRIFKDKSTLEIWAQAKNGKYKYLRQYKICGANTANIPSGIYFINAQSLVQGQRNSFSVATSYPNAYNVAQKQSGHIILAPRCAPAPNIGLTDPDMDEMFAILYKSISKGQNAIQIQVLPFALNGFNMFTAQKKPNYNTLKQLAPIYSKFEETKKVPKITISSSGYKLITK
ncbi:MAG: hypothetical protein LCH83_06145 [Proteobacteria bacterium]|nr:hypothetical protein [Pseudomonadota bacterium]